MWTKLLTVSTLHLPRRAFLGASLGVGAALASGCSVVAPTPVWGELLPGLRDRVPSGLVVKISADAKSLDAVAEDHTLHRWRNGNWSQGRASGDDLASLKPFQLDAFDLGDVAALLDRYECTNLVARQETNYLQPVLTLARGSNPNHRINFTAGMEEVTRLDYVKPADVDLAVRGLAAAASVPPVSVSLAQQSADQDAVFFFGLRDRKSIYLFRRPDMPVQWVGREPDQDYQDLKSFDLADTDPGALATAMNQLRELGKGGDLVDPAATLYLLEGEPAMAVQCTWKGAERSVLTDKRGNVPRDFLD